LTDIVDTLHILLIEDDPGDARLILEIISDVDGSLFSLRRADRLETSLESLRNEPTDLILLDLMLPDSTGLTTLRHTQADAGAVPIVVLAARLDKHLAISAVSHGARDFLIKEDIEREALARVLHLADDNHRHHVNEVHLESVDEPPITRQFGH
jgi:DNA-binding response OmpR family regulator